MVGSMKHGVPLDGVTVLDFSQIEMGPCATQALGDFGADVIKIERPGAGDLSRVHMKHESGESAIFWSLNRNKRSVALDVRAPLGREAIYRLARKADVLVHNFRPGVMERLGFGPGELQALNTRLIYAFGSGYVPTGPYRDKG
jgi:crotonobetainyl-CoA:carnitine CoA-transferase CaiB-like acyl-CoA transferase